MTEKQARNLLPYTIVVNGDTNQKGTVMSIGKYGLVIRWGWRQEEVVNFVSPTMKKLTVY
jgi:uncharacterized Rmd1/YagE family protein